MQKIKKNHLYNLTINSEYIPLDPTIILEILKVVTADYIVNGRFSLIRVPTDYFYASIDWKWMGQRGTLPKRIARWCYEELNHKLSEKTIAEIGNIVRKDLVKSKTYYIDFVDTFDWKAGQFADSGSCFWDGRSAIKRSMEKDGKFMAIRFFKEVKADPYIKLKPEVDHSKGRFYVQDYSYFTGIARAWIYRTTVPYRNKEHEVFVVFNGYGIPTKQISSILSHFTGESLKEISLLNNGSLHGGLYFNGRGYLIGSESFIKDKDEYDFGVPYKLERASGEVRKFKGRTKRKATEIDERLIRRWPGVAEDARRAEGMLREIRGMRREMNFLAN